MANLQGRVLNGLSEDHVAAAGDGVELGVRELVVRIFSPDESSDREICKSLLAWESRCEARENWTCVIPRHLRCHSVNGDSKNIWPRGDNTPGPKGRSISSQEVSLLGETEVLGDSIDDIFEGSAKTAGGVDP